MTITHPDTMQTIFSRASLVLALTLFWIPSQSHAQTFPTEDPIVKAMWETGMENSQTKELAHHLVDVIGPRLSGTEGLEASQDWLIELYDSWGIAAEKQQYGTWEGWDQGILQVDMVEPRVTSLKGEMLAWSVGTDGPVEGDVAIPPAGLNKENVEEWLENIRGKFVMLSAPEIMCRAPQELEANARPETVERISQEREAVRSEWNERLAVVGNSRSRVAAFDSAGAAGYLTSRWSQGWGANKVFSAPSGEAVGIDLSCEDYGLLARLAESGNTPRLRVNAEAESLGEVTAFNVVGRIEGSELPDEYVLLGAHLDSWHAATGATDNGTGTIMMLEAMRIIKETYPNPRRTILVGHWGSEEQGLIGSSAFREDNPDIMEGIQAAFNQDNGTWRIIELEGQGFAASVDHLPNWMSVVPTEISSHIDVPVPGPQANAGSDHTSFICAEIPSFRFRSPYPEYRQYTWHTDRDTYDKIVFDDLAENATLAAMIAYQASEDPVRFDRTLSELPVSQRTGQPRDWPGCRQPRRAMR
jgi:hypothetical protein